MPVWTLTAADEQTRDYNITHYRANSNGTVLAFTARYGDGFEVYTLAPGAHNNDDVVGVFRGVIRIVTREAPYVANHIASARGVVCTLPDVAGYLVELLRIMGSKICIPIKRSQMAIITTVEQGIWSFGD